jgi:hypothetical protein
MFGKKEEQELNRARQIFHIPQPEAAPAAKPIFVEFTGASGSLDEDGMLKDYVPRDKITINVNRISGYYDHTILVEGRKIRVMDSYNQIALKILEAMKG